MPRLEDVRWAREAPTFLFSGTYVAARRHHTLMVLIRTEGVWPLWFVGVGFWFTRRYSGWFLLALGLDVLLSRT